MVDGILLAIGGSEDQSGSMNTSAIFAFNLGDQQWKHVGNMPFACSDVDTLLLSGGGLLMVDGSSTKKVLKITVKGKYCCNETN